jgi:predicted acylesterase/phospholipase RssA
MSGNDLSDRIYSVQNAQLIMPHSIIDDMFGLVQSQPKYDGKGKRKVIEESISDKLMTDTDKDVMVVGYDIVKDAPIFFKSYEPSSARIRDALDISSAAPCYFPVVDSASQEGVVGIDGGVVANNPTDIAYADALRRYGKDTDIEIISIGTGESFDDTRTVHEARKAVNYGSIQWIRKGWLMDIIMNGGQDLIDEKVKQFSNALGHKYIRVNGRMSHLSMDDVTEENVARLKNIGDQWFEKHGKEIVEMLEQ